MLVLFFVADRGDDRHSLRAQGKLAACLRNHHTGTAARLGLLDFGNWRVFRRGRGVQIAESANWNCLFGLDCSFWCFRRLLSFAPQRPCLRDQILGLLGKTFSLEGGSEPFRFLRFFYLFQSRFLIFCTPRHELPALRCDLGDGAQGASSARNILRRWFASLRVCFFLALNHSGR